MRATLDWDDEDAFRAHVKTSFRPKVAVWNATFTMPYHLFRHEVREIARLNLSRVENAVCCSWEEIPDGGLVLPVDDDDWFAPDVAAVMEAHYDARAIGYRWTSSFLEVPINLGHRADLFRRRLFPWMPSKWFCATNNYAVVKRDGADLLARSHMGASHYFTGEAAGQVKKIDQRLSLMNRTLASQTTMGHRRPNVTRSQLVSKLERYQRLYREADLRGLDWSRPYVAMMAELTSRVHVREIAEGR